MSDNRFSFVLGRDRDYSVLCNDWAQPALFGLLIPIIFEDMQLFRFFRAWDLDLHCIQQEGENAKSYHFSLELSAMLGLEAKIYWVVTTSHESAIGNI